MFPSHCYTVVMASHKYEAMWLSGVVTEFHSTIIPANCCLLLLIVQVLIFYTFAFDEWSLYCENIYLSTVIAKSKALIIEPVVQVSISEYTQFEKNNIIFI